MATFYFRNIQEGDVEAAARAASEFVREVPNETGLDSACEYGVQYTSGFQPQYMIHRTSAGNIVVRAV